MSVTAEPSAGHNQRAAEWPFSEFRKRDLAAGLQALAEFEQLSDAKRRTFLPKAEAFLAQEQADEIRAWATGLLGAIGGERAFSSLAGVFRPRVTAEEKRAARFTRFQALKSLARMARTDEQRAEVTRLAASLWRNRWQDTDEDYLVQAEAAALLARDGHEEALAQLAAMLRARQRDFWITWAALRALREFPLLELVESIVLVMRDSWYIDHRANAIRVLAACGDDDRVVHELGMVVRTSRDAYLRLAAVEALAELRQRDAYDALLRAITDENAEVRVQAAVALSATCAQVEACALVIGRALEEETAPLAIPYLVDALRSIDPDRLVCAEMLNKELASDDRRRSRAAEELLVNLGGWAAVHRLSQRRSTLDALDKILAESEQAVKTNFSDTIRQARISFYFAMSVNVLIVCVGIALIVLAILQLIENPEQLTHWVLPGGAGVFGVLITLAFNNPRRNAREDLASLLHVNVMFLGFLRQLNEIDATFKHAYIEDPDFDAKDMRVTVGQIGVVVAQTLDNTRRHLLQPEKNGAAPSTDAVLDTELLTQAANAPVT
jgi:HEAT repeat protein